MKKWILLFFVFFTCRVQADICDHPDYKQVCAKALEAGRVAINPFILKKGSFEGFLHVIEYINAPEFGPYRRFRGGPLPAEELVKVKELYDNMPFTCDHSPNCITQAQADELLPPPAAMATSRVDKKLMALGEDNNKELKSLAEKMKNVSESEFNKVFPEIKFGENACDKTEYKDICTAAINAAIFKWNQIMSLDSKGIPKGVVSEIGKIVGTVITTKFVEGGIDFLREKYKEARSNAHRDPSPSSSPQSNDSRPNERPIHHDIGDNRPSPAPAPCPAPGDGGSCGGNDGGSCTCGGD